MTDTEAPQLTVYDVQLPDEVIERLQDNTRKEDDARWDDGDIAAEVVEEFGPTHGKMLVRQRIAIEAGVSTSTIRSREEMSRYWPLSARADWGSDESPGFDILTWSQWRAIKPARDKWRKLATWAVESADDFGGRPAPVDAILAKRLRDDGSPDPTWENKFMRMWGLCDDIAVMKGAPKPVMDAAVTFQEATDKYHEIAETAK